jgi:hypothetical protein
MLRWILSSLLFVACSSPALPALKKPDGSWHIKCGSMMGDCVKQAEELCKGRGYLVVSGLSKRKLYGAELGASQYEVREAELDVACADRRGDLPSVQSASPPAVNPPAPPAVSPPAPSAPSAVSPPAPSAPSAVSPPAPSAVSPP